MWLKIVDKTVQTKAIYFQRKVLAVLLQCYLHKKPRNWIKHNFKQRQFLWTKILKTAHTVRMTKIHFDISRRQSSIIRLGSLNHLWAATLAILIFSISLVTTHNRNFQPRTNYHYHKIEGKITECWLVNEEGTFS